MDALVRGNIGLVHSLVRRYPWHSQPYEDAVQEGTIGLVRAIRKFDLSLSFKLSTYASWWIWHHVMRSHENGALIRMPARYGILISRVSRAERELRIELDRRPSTAELAERSGVGERDVARILERGRVTHSLDQALGEQDGEDASLHGSLATSVESTAWAELAERERAVTVERAVSSLPPRMRAVIRLRFLGDDDPTLAEVGQTMGGRRVSRERARQLQTLALARLRHRLRAA